MPPIIGYVHDLSRIRQGPKRKWFDMNLQTNGEKRMRAVCFSKDKYSLFAEKQTTITPAKITNYVMSTSLYGSEEEILINDMNVVLTPSPSEYSFQYETNKGLKEEIVGKNNAKMLKCAITDKTGSIPILIWEEEIDQIRSGAVYRFNGVGVRYREQMKYLTTRGGSRSVQSVQLHWSELRKHER